MGRKRISWRTQREEDIVVCQFWLGACCKMVGSINFSFSLLKLLLTHCGQRICSDEKGLVQKDASPDFVL